MAIYRQEPPFAVQVEFSEGCNLYCDFCGLQGIREKKNKNFMFMKSQTARSLAQQMADAGWTSRVEFAMHGEPTMHPEYVDMVRIFREALPDNQLMMTSNGGGLLRPPGVVENLRALFSVGLNVFAFDAYESVKIKDKVMLAVEQYVRDCEDRPEFEVHYYPDDKSVSPHSRYPKSTRLFIRVQDISVADEGTHSVLNNHCGAGAPPNTNGHGKRCAKPFRELSVRFNGNVAICCNDWRGEFKVGNVVKDGLTNVWHDAKLNSARKFLVRGDRHEVSPCDKCDAVSYRVGLLPDKKGKVTLPRPTKRDRDNVAKATQGRSYGTKVRRPWEGV